RRGRSRARTGGDRERHRRGHSWPGRLLRAFRLSDERGGGSHARGGFPVPAAFCGLVGFKTSEQRIDMRGVFPLSRTLDTIGPMAHTVEDCVLIDMALRGQSSASVRPINLSGVDLVVPDRT